MDSTKPVNSSNEYEFKLFFSSLVESSNVTEWDEYVTAWLDYMTIDGQFSYEKVVELGEFAKKVVEKKKELGIE